MFWVSSIQPSKFVNSLYNTLYDFKNNSASICYEEDRGSGSDVNVTLSDRVGSFYNVVEFFTKRVLLTGTVFDITENIF